MPHNPIISIQNVSKIYGSGDKALHALSNVSLDITEGEIIGLLGVNGAGKTTLSSILATLHPATSGDVLFYGQSIYTNLATYRRALGFCPQKANLDSFLSVRENLIFAGRYFLMPEALIQERADQLLAQFELTRYRDFMVNQLSGGTQQRLLIARALMHKPKIVIFDEPTVGLDPDIRRKLWDVIKSLKAEGITIILTTHYLDEAEYLSDRIALLHRGILRLVASVTSLKEKYGLTKLEDLFLKIVGEYHAE